MHVPSCFSYRSDNANINIKTDKIHLQNAFQEEFCKNDNNPLQLLEIEELKSQVNTVIDSLSVKCRLVFEKYLYEGMSPQEIADEQAISVNTVRVHIKNAMDHIKLQLGPTAGILFLFLYGRL